MKLSKVDEAAVVNVKRINYMLRFANDEVTVFKNWVEENAHIYLTRGKRTAAVTTSGGLDLEMVEREIEKLSELPEDPLYVPVGGPPLFNYMEEEKNFEKLVDIVKTAIDAAGARSAGVARLVYQVVNYEDTTGRSGHYAVNKMYMTMRSFAGDLAVTSAMAGRDFVNSKRIGEVNSQLLNLARGLPKKRVEPRRATVVLSPLVAGHLMGEVVSHWTNAMEVISGSSRYAVEDLGKEVASPQLSIVEKTYDPASYGYVPFDFEGVTPRRVEIFQRGVLREFIHNRRTAAKFGVESTGHAIDGWVRPAPSHVEIAPGDAPHDVEAVMSEAKSGYYIHNNWYTRYQNIKTGQFSTVGRDLAFEIVDGKPAAVVKFIRIADTLENLLRHISALSKAVEQVYWWDMPTPATAPYVVIESVGITT